VSVDGCMQEIVTYVKDPRSGFGTVAAINFCLKISLPPSLRATSLVRGRQYEFCIDIKQIFKQNSQSSRYLLIFIGNDALPPSDEGGGLP